MKTVNNYTETDLGNVSPNPRGEYDNATSYEYLDLVSLGGGSYLCLAELGQKITGIAPVEGENTEHWQCVAIPGEITEEYTEIYADVKRLARETKEDAEKSETAKTGAETAQRESEEAANASIKAAQESENSKDSSAGYMQRAETAAQTAESVKGTVENLVNGFDEHVASKATEAEQAITTAKDNAVSVVTRQEKASVQEVKDQTASYITEQKNLAKQEIDDKIQTFDVDVNAIKQQVANEGTKQVQAVQDAQTKATEAVETAKTNAVQTVRGEGTTQVGNVTAEGTKQLEILQAETAQFTEDREQIQTNKTDIADLRQTKAGAIVESASGETIVVRDSSDNFFEDFRVFGKSEQGENPSVDNPQEIKSVGENGTIKIKLQGKNLIPFPYLENNKTENGITWIVHDNGAITVKGTATEEVYFNLCNVDFGPEDFFTYDHVNYREYTVSVSKTPKNVYISYSGATKLCYLTVQSGKTVDATLYPHIEYGRKKVAMAYEQYKTPQTLTLQTPNGLPGIPGEYGGNYMDSTGKQWICNEIDFKRGEYIQRIKKDALDKYDYAIQSVNEHGIVNFMTSLADSINGENKILCTHLTEDTTLIAQTTNEGIFLINTNLYIRIKQERFDTVQKLKEWLKTNNVVVYYTLETPIKTELTQEEIEAYKKLHTYYPTTVISNSEDCEMEVEYVADTKNYIDNKISANVASIISQYQTNVANLLSLMPLETQATMIENDTNNILENVEEMKHE